MPMQTESTSSVSGLTSSTNPEIRPNLSKTSLHGGTAQPFGSRSAAPAAARQARTNDVTLKDLVALYTQGLLIIRSKWYWGLLAALIVGGLSGYALLRRPVEYSAETV